MQWGSSWPPCLAPESMRTRSPSSLQTTATLSVRLASLSRMVGPSVASSDFNSKLLFYPPRQLRLFKAMPPFI